MNKKYEISVWRDVFSNEDNRWHEEKLIVIGSDTMTSQSRAREPKLVSSVNGTNKFSFTIYYSYIDTETGETVKNPYTIYLVNERKIKVFWKDKWYDFLIKEIKEDSIAHTFTYTCEDQYLTELSRTGFSLEFNSQLQNNIGTPEELISKVIENTDWQFDSENSDTIYQLTEESVYVVNTVTQFSAKKDPSRERITIPAGSQILVFYSCAPAAKADALKTTVQFLYTTDDEWQQDDNDMLVLNGDCCEINVKWNVNTNYNTATAMIGGTEIFGINFTNGISKKYRAKRYVDSQKTVFSPVVNRYVDVYEKDGKEIYGFSTTDFNDALAVVNLVTNSSNFANPSGWTKDDSDEDGLLFRISPPFDQNTVVAEYEAKSYLRVCGGRMYLNSGIQNNRSYIKDGFSEDEVYIFRYRCLADVGGAPERNGAYKYVDIIPYIQTKTGIPFFSTISNTFNDGWNEYKLKCIKPCSYDNLLTINQCPVIHLQNNMGADYWLEEVQFFKEAYGEKVVDDQIVTVRINPNEMDVQSVVNVTYKFFDPEQEASTIDEVEFISGENYTPVSNGFQRYGTIEESESNRFNILQTIAETFECWVRFKIDHDDEGYVLYDDKGAPCKYVQLKNEIGRDSGLTFVYGIDLQGIVRNLKSTSISTKTIVRSNDNQFGKNGFCTIARSTQNFPRENTIYNFDYYIQQGLLDKNTLDEDLYGPGGLNYYNYLHDNNVQYMANLEVLTSKRTEYSKQKAQQTVYNQYLSASEQERAAVENDLIKLAGADTFEQALEYAKSHLDNKKVQALVNDHTYIVNTICNYQNLYDGITAGLELLESTIDDLESEQEQIIQNLTDKNTEFYKKYSRFIQEGTWSSEKYYNDDLYYLDALQVAYESSRPQITYTINVLRVSELEDFKSKVFYLADIAYIQDTEYFGYKDKFTPYKEKVSLTEITSFFDSPEKDTLKVQNYLTQFDDLFQRITAATQNLEFSQGKYAKAANIVATDGTIKPSIIQQTFNSNADLVYGAQNESATIDNTGITVTSNDDGSKLVKVTSGGIFVTNDGGQTWKNAIRGDGISTDLLTAGRINTNEISIYNGESPTFRWDSYGINAYGLITRESEGQTWVETDMNRFVRFDQYGVYGLHWTKDYPFIPETLEDIYENAQFGFTWEKFFMKSATNNGSVEISSDTDIVIKGGNDQIRVLIGRLGYDSYGRDNYGITINDDEGNAVFRCDNEKTFLAGWNITEDCLESSNEGQQHIRINADGNIGCYGNEEYTQQETVYRTNARQSFQALNLKADRVETISSGSQLYVFASTIGKMSITIQVAGNYVSHLGQYDNAPTDLIPRPSNIINFIYNNNNYQILLDDSQVVSWNVTQSSFSYVENKINPTGGTESNNILTDYTYNFSFQSYLNNSILFDAININSTTSVMQRYVPASSTKWLIDNNGDAIFHNIYADGGTIAGWYIDGESIYQTWDGTANRGNNNSNVKVELNSSGTANKNGVDYSIITDAINSAMANIGGVLMSGGLINGYNIAAVMKRANDAMDRANSAYNLAYAANTKAGDAQSSVSSLRSSYNSHTHRCGGTIYNSYVRTVNFTNQTVTTGSHVTPWSTTSVPQ